MMCRMQIFKLVRFRVVTHPCGADGDVMALVVKNSCFRAHLEMSKSKMGVVEETV